MAIAPLTITCHGASMIGVLHRPDNHAGCRRGLVIVVGGPQYRVGSGRQFVTLANAIAAAGVPVLRFDYRGMGDSDGEFQGFLAIDDDIRAAIDALIEQQPAIDEVILWGLCDASSAILLYAHRDPRVTGIVLLNPWVRSETGQAKAYLRYYYIRRLLSRQFWQKVARLKFNPIRALLGVTEQVQTAAGGADSSIPVAGSYQARMLSGLRQFRGRVLLILSGNDLTAREFELLVSDDKTGGWRQRLAESGVEQRRLAQADHTFSRREWLDQVIHWTRDWLLAAPAVAKEEN